MGHLMSSATSTLKQLVSRVCYTYAYCEQLKTLEGGKTRN